MTSLGKVPCPSFPPARAAAGRSGGRCGTPRARSMQVTVAETGPPVAHDRPRDHQVDQGGGAGDGAPRAAQQDRYRPGEAGNEPPPHLDRRRQPREQRLRPDRPRDPVLRDHEFAFSEERNRSRGGQREATRSDYEMLRQLRRTPGLAWRDTRFDIMAAVPADPCGGPTASERRDPRTDASRKTTAAARHPAGERHGPANATGSRCVARPRDRCRSVRCGALRRRAERPRPLPGRAPSAARVTRRMPGHAVGHAEPATGRCTEPRDAPRAQSVMRLDGAIWTHDARWNRRPRAGGVSHCERVVLYRGTAPFS